MQAIITIAIIVGVALGIAVTYPDRTRRLYNGVSAGARVVYSVLILLVGFVFIGTMNFRFVLIGALIWMLGAWWLWFGVLDESAPEVRY